MKTMRKLLLKILGFAPLFAAFLLIVLTGCQNPLQQRNADAAGTAGTGTGTLSLIINGQNAARTIMPLETALDDFVRFELDFIPYNSGRSRSVSWCAERDLTDGIGTVELNEGTWDLVITAFIKKEGVEVAAARSGPDRIVILSGENVKTNVVLLPAGGVGTFSWDIELRGSEIAAVQMEILHSGRNFRRSYYLAGGDAPIGLAGSLDDLDAGQYLVVFTLSNGEKSVRATEVLRVYAYRTSHFEGGFSDDIFTVSLLRTVLDAWNGNVWDFDGAGIEAGHFALLDIEGADDGNGGFADGIVGWFNTLTLNGGNPIVLDYDAADVLDQLKALVDAALIGIASTDLAFLFANYGNHSGAARAISGFVRNSTDIRFEWTDNNTVMVSAGSYNVEITFLLGLPIPGNTLAAQLAWLRAEAQSGNNYLVEISANESISPDSATLPAGRSNLTVILKGDGEMRYVSLSANGSLFSVGSGVTLVLDNNITLRGRAGNDDSLVRVSGGGALVMNAGTRITGNSNDADSVNAAGGGVIVLDGGAFTMRGGRINDNSADWGGGVQVQGTFTMQGGVISDNTGRIGGGGIDNRGMSDFFGGEISANTADQGGGIKNRGVFSIHGGAAISGNNARQGGGVLNMSNSGVFNMHGGEISGNNAAVSGGGVDNYGGATFSMSGGVIFGTDAGPELANHAPAGPSLHNDSSIFRYGTFARGSFNSRGTLTTTADTIRVVNGNLICLECGEPLPCTGCPRTYEESVQRVVFTGNTATVTFSNLSGNNIYLLRVNTAGNLVAAIATGSVLHTPPNLTRIAEPPLDSRTLVPGAGLPPIGHPAALEFSVNPPPTDRGRDRDRSALPAPLTPFVPPVVGDTRLFWVEAFMGSSNWVQRPAVLLATGIHGNIWVMNDGITSAQAQALSDQFDKIYPASVNILGFEYGGGPHGHGGMDGDPKVQILVYDILDAFGNVAAAGFFWAKDWFTQAELDAQGWNMRTNMAEIFYMDSSQVRMSPLWAGTVLTHELQHMINWNVNSVRNGQNAAAWYNEMLSLMAEEVMADLISLPPTNWFHPAGRMPDFLQRYHEAGFTEWHQDLLSYARVYAFGAFLLRNFGGAELLQNIMASGAVNIASITAALQATAGVDFFYALRRFGEAMIFSGDSIPERALTFDRSVRNTINGFTYTSHAFDIWGRWNGPQIFDLTPRTMRPHSVLLQSSNAWINRWGNISITLQRPTHPNIELYLLVR